MQPSLSPAAATFTLALLANAAPAQNTARVAPIPGAVKHAGTYHVATGEWTRGQQTFGILMQDSIYRNDIASGYFGLLDQSEIAHDEGRLPGDGQPLIAGGASTGTADVYEITGFQFGYCALNSNAVEYTLGFFNAYAPCGNPTGIPSIASFITTGLPNNGCWIVAFDISGTTAQFVIDAEGGDGSWDNDNALDNFGYTLNINGGQGDGTGQTTHGPILSGNLNNAASIGDGTVFQNPGNAGTGLGTEDLFWLISPVVADGCYFYGGCTPCANFNTGVFGFGNEGDPPGFCSPANPNSVSASGALLASTGGFGTAVANFNISDVPAQPGVLFTGPGQGQIPFGCGDRCVVGAGVLRYGPFNVGGGASNAFDVTIDMSISANSNIQYWYRDPANAPVCGASFNLSNGIGL